MVELAAAVRSAIASHRLLQPTRRAVYAGVSLGGAVGLQLALDAPDALDGLVVLAAGARIGTGVQWRQRADAVRRDGTSALVESSRRRWFAAGFADREPAVVEALLEGLHQVDDDSYAWACEALATHDVSDRLPELNTSLLVVGGSADVVVPPRDCELVASKVRDGRVSVLPGVGHLAPVEAPRVAASLIASFSSSLRTLRHVHQDGERTRREVLGDQHVDRAIGRADEHSQEFQDLITRYAWDGVWNRPGLDRRIRSAVTLTALVAHGHWEELALHVSAAARLGLSRDEVTEVLLQTAVYCGVPAANAAFRVAQQVWEQDGGQWL